MVIRKKETPITLGWKDKLMKKSGGMEEKNELMGKCGGSEEKSELIGRSGGTEEK
jgi:hypothetical protein